MTTAIQGLAGGNIAQVLVGASAPYLAETIKQMTKGNEEARIRALPRSQSSRQPVTQLHLFQDSCIY
ncbi:MAG TPA: hypothetical protein VJ889_27445 [Pseudomonas sp.]|nr:hypothetical protein [Pseudomonas sp.]